MRVLQVSEPGLDGVFRHVEGLVAHLVEQGVEVDLAWSSRRPSPDLFRLVDFVAGHGGRTVDLRVGPTPGPADLLALARLWSLAIRREPDLIHAHSSKAGALVRLLAPMLAGPLLLYTPHAYYGLDGGRSPRTRVFHAVETALGSTCPTIHVSTDERDFGLRTFGLDRAQCIVLGHGVDPQRFGPVSAEQRALRRARFGLDASYTVVGTMGRIGPQKDYPTLYRALAPLLHEREGLRLLQVGKGRDAAAVRELARALSIADRIVAVESLDRAEEFYQAVDLVVLSPVYEAGIPYVALEALACGLPLVATLCPGLRTLAAEPFDAVSMARAGDPVALRAAIRERLAHPGPNNHRAVVLERFTLDRARQRVLEIYSSTLGRHGEGTVTLLS